MTVKWFIKI